MAVTPAAAESRFDDAGQLDLCLLLLQHNLPSQKKVVQVSKCGRLVDRNNIRQKMS